MDKAYGDGICCKAMHLLLEKSISSFHSPDNKFYTVFDIRHTQYFYRVWIYLDGVLITPVGMPSR